MNKRSRPTVATCRPLIMPDKRPDKAQVHYRTKTCWPSKLMMALEDVGVCAVFLGLFILAGLVG